MKLSRTSIAALVVAIGAGAALLLLVPDRAPEAPPARAPLVGAWPTAQRADLPGYLADGPLFQAGLFLDARTAIGTAPTPDGDALRLVLRGSRGEIRELRRRPLSEAPAFEHFAVAGDRLAWTETAGRRTEIWTAGTAAGDARRLTADTGDPLFYGTPYDLVVADQRVHWVAAAGADATEIRSVPLTGGPVRVRTEPGVWSLTTWPWLTSGAADRAGATVLRDLTTNREQRVPATGAELTSCTPAWCRVMVTGADGPVRIDIMRPDGSQRRRIAGPTAVAAVNDVAVLDRFEVLAEARPDSDLTGEQGLLVFDIATGRTVDLTAAATAAGAGNGVVWWSTGDQDSLEWHTVDLRTV